MTKRKRLILPWGALEADAIELGFDYFMGDGIRPRFSIVAKGNPVTTIDSVDAAFPRDVVLSFVPFGTPIEVQTL